MICPGALTLGQHLYVIGSAKRTLNNFVEFIFSASLKDPFNVHSLTKNRLDQPFEFEDTLADGSKNYR